jgi:hypothetical protein
MNILKQLLGFRAKKPTGAVDVQIAAEQLQIGETLTFGDKRYVLQRIPDDQGLQRYTIKDANGRLLYDCPEPMLLYSLRDLL